MKKLMLASALVATSFLPLAANAGFYAEAQGGYTQLDTNKNIASNNDIGGFSYGLRAGFEKNINDKVKLGLEVGAADLGESKFGSTLTLSQKALDLLGTASLSVNDDVDVYVKAGAASVRQESKLASSTVKKTETEPMAAVGVSYNLNEQVALTGSVEHVFADEVNSGNYTAGDKIASSTSANVGLRVKF